MELHAVGMLTALAAAVFASLLPADRKVDHKNTLLLAALFFAVAFAATPSRLPPAAVIGAATVVVAALALAKPQWARAVAVSSGLFAAFWVSVLRAQGLPFAAALCLAAAPAALGAWFARRAEFAPSVVREEALLLVGGFGLVIALGSEVVAGWRSGLVLSAAPIAQKDLPGGEWLVVLVAVCFVLGGLYSLWRRTRR